MDPGQNIQQNSSHGREKTQQRSCLVFQRQETGISRGAGASRAPRAGGHDPSVPSAFGWRGFGAVSLLCCRELSRVWVLQATNRQVPGLVASLVGHRADGSSDVAKVCALEEPPAGLGAPPRVEEPLEF